MNKTLPLVLVAAVILGGVLMFVLSGEQDGRGGGAASPGAEPEQATERAAADLARPTDLATAPTETSARTEAPDVRATPAMPAIGNSENFATADARWVDVTVLLPDGVPADDAPALISFSYGNGEELGNWRRGSIAEEVGLTGDFVERVDDDLVWARRELAGTTTVRMPFHPDADEGLLVLQSKYVYADSPGVQLGENAAPVTIEGELGAYVTGVCLIPAGAESRNIEAKDIDIEMNGRARDGGMAFAMSDSREPLVHDDFTFELRALSANKKYMVNAQAEKLVDYFQISFTAEAGRHTVLEIPFKLGGEISGRVVGDDGKPIAEAELEVESGGMMFGDNEEEVETAADGTFVLSGIAAGKADVRVRAAGWREKSVEDLEIGEGETISGYEIVLERGNSISGVVRWADGTPAADADVEAFVIQQRGWRSGAGDAETDEDGNFTITGLEEGPFELRAEANPDPTKRRHGSRNSVRIRGADIVFEELTTETADSGDETSDVGGDSDWVAVLASVTANASGVELILEEPLVLSGFVRDDTGAPITTEFVVEARPAGSSEWGSNDEVDDDFQSADGSFHLQGVFPGEWMVTVEAEGYSTPEDSVSVTIPITVPIELTLLRGAAVAGVVLDPFGKAVADASVVTQQGGQGNPFNFRGGEDTKTDADGRFTFDGLSPEGLSLVASHSDWASSEAVAVEATAGGSTDDVVIPLRVGAVITGEVFDENGEPDAGQNVSAGSQAMGGFGGGQNSQVTDSAGRFRFEHVTPGQVVVTAMPREEDIIEAMEKAGGDETAMLNFMGQMRMERVEVKDGEEVHVVLGAKPKDPVKVTGRVTEAGSPLTETQIIVIEEGGSIMEGLKATTTDADGRYEVTVDRPGDFVFNVDMDGGGGTGIPFFVDVPEQPDYQHDLVLPLGKISGHVFAPDGSPAGGVSIKVSQMGGVFGLEDFNMMTNSATTADGSYEFEHLSPGKYSLQVGGMGTFFDGTADKYGAEVVDGIELGEDELVDDIDVHLSAPGKLTGTVRDTAGEPVAGASIFVCDAKGRALANISATMTDGAGRFTYEGIAPGAVTVCARTSEYASHDVGPVDIVSGETSEVDIEVDVGTYVVVTLLDGDELVRARVQVTNENGVQVNGLISAAEIQQLLVDGFSSKERRVGPVPPGKYTLVATTQDGKDAKKSVRIKAGQAERKVKLRLK